MVRPASAPMTPASRAIGMCASAFLLGVAGCNVGPDYRAPQAKTPLTWASPTTVPTTRPSNATTRPAEVVEWWSTFNDPKLNSLVTRAVVSNLDMKLAESRIRQARAARGFVAAGEYPSVTANGSYSRQRTSQGNAPTGLYQTNLDASWELDIFGQTRRGVESADANIQSAVEDRRDVLVTLAAEVAINYIDLRGFQQAINIANENLALQTRSADLTRRRFKGGLNSMLDVANSDALVATTRAQIPSLEQSVQQTIYRLSVLLALQPAALNIELTADAAIPTTPPEVPIGLPSELLRRRPDIRRAEAQLHGATALIGVATADLFPKFSLTGALGTAGSQPRSLVNWDNRFYAFGPQVSWNVFDAGRIRSNIEIQNAVQEQALITYQKTVLTALQEVESSLVAYVKEQQHRQALGEAVAANQKAVDLAMKLYTLGQTDFLNVLDAQRSLLTSQDQLVTSDRTIATNLVSLFKALGGGWDLPKPTTRPATAPVLPPIARLLPAR